MSLNAVGSRIELERYLDSVRYAQSLSLERVQQASVKTKAASFECINNSAQSSLQSAKPEMEASQMLLHSASTTALDVKTKIEDVLEAYERTVSAKQMVEQVTTLRTSIQGVHSAMEVNDFERAAQLVSKALEVPEHVVKSEFARKMVPSAELPDDPERSISAACDKMEEMFTKEFNQAASQVLKGSNNNSSQQLTRFFKLFPLIGRANVGLNMYSKFICQIIAQMARNLLISAAKATMENPTFYAAALAKLFENVAVIVEQHSKIIQRHYGADAMAMLLPQVQHEIDKQSLLIVDTFWDERRLEQLLSRCRRYDYPVLINSFMNNTEAPQDLDAFNNNEDLQEAGNRLAEISTMLNRFTLYVRFVRTRFNVNLEPEFETKVEDLLGPTFSTLSLYVFRRSVEVAVHLDELPTQERVNEVVEFQIESPLVSSLVDDVVYMLTNVLQQSMQTNNAKTGDSALAGIKRVLESDLVGTLQRKLRSVAPASSTVSSEFGGAGPFMLYLNDLQVLVYYLDEIVKKQHQDEGNEKELIVIVDKLNQSFKSKCDELINDGCQTLFNSRLLSQTRSAVNAFKNNVNEFESQWRSTLRPLKQLLHPKILSRLVHLMCRNTAQDLEQYLWSLDGRVTASTLLELESDINSAVSCCVETQYSLRQSFTKLVQVVNALVEGETTGLSAEDAARVSRFKVN